MPPALGAWVETQALHAPYWAISAATLLWFVLIYTLIAGGAYWIALYRIPDAITNTAGRR